MARSSRFRFASVAGGFAAAVALAALTATPAVAQQPRPDLLNDTVVLKLPGMDKVTVRPNLLYKQAGERRLAFDLYLPPGSDAKGSAAPKGTRYPLVVFANGVGDFGELAVKDWGVYKAWSRLTAVSGMAAVVYNARQESPVEDLADLMKHLRAQAADLRIDPDDVCIWSCSANVRATLSYTLDPANTFIKAAVFYYGALDPAVFRADLPIFLGRAGLDPMTNRGFDLYAAKAVAENAPVTVANLPNGRHAFDVFDDNDGSRAVVRQTLAFMKETLSPGYQAGRAQRAEQVNMLALSRAKNWPAAAEAGAVWVKSDPENGFAKQLYAEALYNLKKYPDAGAAYAEAGDLGAAPAMTWYNG
ncbi:MAG TPA: hypothetical protein VJV75_00895, partial [Candidatus Polarisedimenticolia bacterium]|nr:hypothetical protein [Candidatus Polarisedimenticolia bacterium]